MQIGYKILIFIVVTTALIFSHLYTYFIASEKAKFEGFLSDISYSSILLGALENNKTAVVKSLLIDNIDRVFIETENRDIYKFISICKRINNKNLWRISEHNLSENLPPNNIENRINIGKKKIQQLCGSLD